MANARAQKEMNEVRETMYQVLEGVTFEGMEFYGRSAKGLVFQNAEGNFQTVSVVVNKKPEVVVEDVEDFEVRTTEKAQKEKEKAEKAKKKEGEKGE